MSADEYPVWKKGAEEYPAPLRVVGPGAVFVEHRLRSPQVAESAYIAPTAVSPATLPSVRTAGCCSAP